MPFLPQRRKIEKNEKLVADLLDQTEYVMHIRNLKQTLNHGLVLKKVYRVIKFRQHDWYEYEYWSKEKSKKWFWKI